MRRPARLLAASAALALAAPAAAGAQATLLHHFDFNSDLSSRVTGDLTTGALVGTASLVDGFLRVGGTSAYANFAAPIIPVVTDQWGTPPASWSVSVFARQRVAQTGMATIVGQGAATGYLPDYNLGINAGVGDQPGTGFAYNRWGWGGATNSPNPVTVGTWHHFVTVGAWNYVQFYIDGVLVGEGGQGGYPCCYTSQSTRLGQQVGGFGAQFDGDIDELRTYSGSLTADQIRGLWQTGPSVGGTADPLVTPEPASVALLGAGLLAVGGAARHRRRAAAA